jgi:aspartate ammonia-lyase
MTKPALRTEHDPLGPVRVPADAYWGANTARAVANFPVTGRPINTLPGLVHALAAVKQACAVANAEMGLLNPDLAEAIIRACIDVRTGMLDDHFVVDVVQGGAGTSTNMNANEVIANRALELLGHPRGDWAALSPNDHVNLSQSTNDTYPTAIRVGLYGECGKLLDSLTHLAHAFLAKADGFDAVIKMGRTQLQDAVPMTLGQELRACAVTISAARDRLTEARTLLSEVNLGGTAIGTGINTITGYAVLACQHLAQIAAVPVRPAADLIEATQDTGALVHLSSVLKGTAAKLSKICNDLRLLSSGPDAGFADIQLPAVQAGSSIMPGKVNPVIPEVVNQIAFLIIGRDVTITLAAEAGQLQLNPFEPVIALSLFDSISELATGCRVLADRCVSGIDSDADRLAARVQGSTALVTALAPLLGYTAATTIARTSHATGQPIREILATGPVPAAVVDELVRDPVRLTKPSPSVTGVCAPASERNSRGGSACTGSVNLKALSQFRW